MRIIDLNETIPMDVLKVLKSIDFQDEKEELEKAFSLYERKVARLKLLTRNYSVKYGYYYQSRLKGAMVNYDIAYVNVTNDQIKAFNKFNELYSDKAELRDFDNDFIQNIKELHGSLLKVYNKGKLRTSNKKIIHKFDNEITILPIKHDKISEYLNIISDVDYDDFRQGDCIVNSWIIHCFITSIQPFNTANDIIGRFILNKNINIHFEEDIFIDEYILEDVEGYYNAIINFCCNIDIHASVRWFIKTLNYAINEKCKFLDMSLIKFYELLEEFEEMELVIARNAEMLSALFCIEGVYLQNDIFEYFSNDILDRRTINKVLGLLVEKEYLIKDGKKYMTKGAI